GTVTVTAGSASIVADGSSSTLITATVKDANGNNIADGTTVNFTTTAGTLSAASATTTNGVATVTLTSPTNLGSATVTATCGGASGTVSVSFIAGAVSAITLTATPNNLTADASSTSTIKALVTDAQGNAVADGETISFSVTTGTGTLSAPTATTTSGGATVTYTASRTAGTETVTAEAANGTANTVNVTLIEEEVGNIVLTLGASSLVADGQNSTLVTATVTNSQGATVNDGTTVTFTTTGGDIDSATAGDQLTVNATTTDGVTSAILRSGTTAGQYVVTATSGSISQFDSIEFTPGSAADIVGTTLTANPSVIDADGASTCLITYTVVDENNNPVADGTAVDFYTTAGALSPESTTTKNGVATTTLTSSTTNETATVTGIVDGVSKTVDVTFGTGPGTGEPVYIIITVDPATIQVKGTGGVESATITALVKDENGQPYNDSADNIRFDILTGPNGGEVLDSGDGSPSASKTTTTVGGIANVSLNSGTISGTVRVKVTVLKDGTGGVLGTPLMAISTEIGIEAGDPFNITIYTAPTVVDNGDGSISWIISAMVQDQYGNPVADNTGVYFGVVDNVLSSAANGVTNATNTFTSVGTDFVTAGVVQFDTLIITEGQDEGGHIIDTPANGSVTLSDNLIGSEPNLDFVAGNAKHGEICGVVPTGNLEPDTTCTPSSGSAIKGVAHTRLTWASRGIWKPFYLYAESEGRNMGDSLSSSYPAVAPVTIDVTIVPSTVTGGNTVSVYAHLYDGATNPHDIRDQTLTFTTSDTTNTGFGAVGTATETDITDENGVASADLVTGVVGSQTTVTITVNVGRYSGTATLTIN
ncbi:MAG: Ig-like domain-containing protein, partial [Deltaproteobacteria bacterium]|nr:Ig-like domain-containing protein [Deltaproteobacteria bacterium]